MITAGALVTSNDAGLSVPDWPTSFGYLVKVPHFVGGVRYEWSHRMVAGTLVTLTLAIAVWTLLVERRRWLRWLAVGCILHSDCAGDAGRAYGFALSAAVDFDRPRDRGANFFLHRRCHRAFHRTQVGGRATAR